MSDSDTEDSDDVVEEHGVEVTEEDDDDDGDGRQLFSSML